MIINGLEIQGLTNEAVPIAKEKFGQNKLNYKKGNEFFDALKRIAKDIMMIMLFTA